MSKVSDMLISYLLKGGILLETKGEFETDINLPMGTEDNKKIEIRIKCKDLTIRTIKEDKN